MRSLTRTAALLVLLIALPAVAAVVPVSQERQLRSSASAGDEIDYDSGTDAADAPDFGPFVQWVGVTINLDSAYGSGSANQNSTIQPDGIHIVGQMV